MALRKNLSIGTLQRAFKVHNLRKVFTDHNYVAVFQLMGGRAWGRSAMRHRIVGNIDGVDARFAAPWAAREAVQELEPFQPLESVFSGGPCALLYGNEIESMVQVIKIAREKLDGAFLIAGRFADVIVTGKVWNDIVDGKDQRTLMAEFLGTLKSQDRVVGLLNASAKQLLGTIQVRIFVFTYDPATLSMGEGRKCAVSDYLPYFLLFVVQYITEYQSGIGQNTDTSSDYYEKPVVEKVLQKREVYSK